MDIRKLSPDYSVAPQIDPAEAAAIAKAGFVAVICNRPDGEVPPELQAEAMRRAVEAAGLSFSNNPVIGGAMTQDNLVTQQAAMRAAEGPVLAYCASGNRSSIVWSFLQAGVIPTEEILSATRAAGYAHDGLREDLERVAAERRG